MGEANKHYMSHNAPHNILGWQRIIIIITIAVIEAA
jgi:hypothetical protein